MYIIVCWNSLWQQIITNDSEIGTNLHISFEPCIYAISDFVCFHSE